MKKMKKVCVLGAGLMRNDIARICAQAGLEVAIRDIEQRLIDGGINAIEKNLSRDVKNGKKTQKEADAILARIKPTQDLREAARDADAIIEVIMEKMEVKKQLYKELDEIVPADCLYLTNTLGLRAADMAALTRRPEKVIAANFFNPVPVMRQLLAQLAQAGARQNRLAA
jgi:3-hydroxybutyryl-CoA dehydrogenase